MPTLYPVVMCGGAGTRLWPLSRKSKPKQFHAISGEKSMLQETIARAHFAKGLDVAAPSFVCALDYETQVADQCKAEGMDPLRIILEPCARNTAPVAAVIALEIHAVDPDGLILLLPADHHIDRPEDFWKAVSAGIPAARNGNLTTFGIAPTRPETGYGYIRSGSAIDDNTVKVDAFVEKPDAQTAQKYLDGGDYFWNAGIFLFSPKAMIEAFTAHASDILDDSRAALDSATRKDASVFLDPVSFSSCRSDSIDYAIMENASKVAMVCPVDIGWNDIGSWEVIRERALAGGDLNAEIGDVISVDCSGSYLRSEGPLLSAIGIKDLIVVATPQSVMITTADKTQHVKTIVNTLKDAKRTDFL